MTVRRIEASLLSFFLQCCIAMLLVGTGIIAGHLHAIFLLGDLHAEGAIVKRNCHFAVEVCVCVCMYCVTRYM